MLAGGAIAWHLKAQSTTALSFMETKFYAAISAAKVCHFLGYVLNCLGQIQTGPTLIYEDNKDYINIGYARNPTDRIWHNAILYYKVQELRKQDVIKLIHNPGIINTSDVHAKPFG